MFNSSGSEDGFGGMGHDGLIFEERRYTARHVRLYLYRRMMSDDAARVDRESRIKVRSEYSRKGRSSDRRRCRGAGRGRY